MFKKILENRGGVFKGKNLFAGRALIVILALAVIIGGAYLVKSEFFPKKDLKPKAEISVEDQEILNNLKKIMLLPEDIAPTMAVITDAQKLKADQPEFFANAKNGDRLIIYPTQAIIFDSEANKIIKVGAVKLNQNEQVRMVKIAVYNGSGTAGAAETAAQKLQSAFNNIEITEKSDAARKDYEKTLVVNLGTDIDVAKFAEVFGIEVSELPEGENKPEGAEMLIIVGKK